MAVALAVVTIYLLMQRGDKGLAIASGAVLMVVSVPVIALLLARPGPKPPAA